MTDDQYRGLLTEREREILCGDTEVSDSYYRRVKSRVRDKIDKVGTDQTLLDQHEPKLAERLRSRVCE